MAKIIHSKKYQDTRPVLPLDMISDTKLRNKDCWYCTYYKRRRKQSKIIPFIFPVHNYCNRTHLWNIKTTCGNNCKEYKDRRSADWMFTTHEYPCVVNTITNYRTEKQWNRSGYCVKPEANGTVMYENLKSWDNGDLKKTHIYYSPEEVAKIRED